MRTNTPTPESRSKAFAHAGTHEGAETPQAPTPGSGSEQLALFNETPDAAEVPTWLAFTGDHDPDAARQRFQDRYQQAPRRCVKALGGLLLVGPVPTVLLAAVLALAVATPGRCYVDVSRGAAWLVCPCRGVSYVCEDWYRVPVWSGRS